MAFRIEDNHRSVEMVNGNNQLSGLFFCAISTLASRTSAGNKLSPRRSLSIAQNGSRFYCRLFLQLQLPTHPLNARFTAFTVVTNVFRMRRTQIPRNQHINVIANDFFTFVSPELLCGGVENITSSFSLINTAPIIFLLRAGKKCHRRHYPHRLAS